MLNNELKGDLAREPLWYFEGISTTFRDLDQLRKFFFLIYKLTCCT